MPLGKKRLRAHQASGANAAQGVRAEAEGPAHAVEGAGPRGGSTRAGAGAEPAPKQEALSSTIKDELILISFLVLFVGIISTETYYHVFGVRYQFLSLPT